MVFEASDSQSSLSVLFFQQPGVLEGDLHVHALEDGVAEREKIAFLFWVRGSIGYGVWAIPSSDVCL